MKYKFIKVDDDITKLEYKEKSFEIKKDVRVMTDLQSLEANARKRMLFDLSRDGISVKDLTIEKKVDNKTIYDNSNAKEMEQVYINEQTLTVFNELSIRYFKQSLVDLILDIGLETSEETNDFGVQFIEAIIGKKVDFPSIKETK